jgi:hypothetical protein
MYTFSTMPGAPADMMTITMPFQGMVQQGDQNLKGLEFDLVYDSKAESNLIPHGTQYRTKDKISVMTFGMNSKNLKTLEIEYAGSNFGITLRDKDGNLRTEFFAVDRDPASDNNIDPSKVIVKVNGKVIAAHTIAVATSAPHTAAPVSKQPTTSPTPVMTFSNSTGTPTTDPRPTINTGGEFNPEIIVLAGLGGLIVIVGCVLLTAAHQKRIVETVKQLSSMKSNGQIIPSTVNGIPVVNIDRDIEMTPRGNRI